MKELLALTIFILVIVSCGKEDDEKVITWQDPNGFNCYRHKQITRCHNPYTGYWIVRP